MASSLDDMEAYELLQIELDRSLQVFSANLSNKAQTLYFLNSWIEYICFVRHLWKWEEVIANETEKEFVEWHETLSDEKCNESLLHALKSFYAMHSAHSARV
jgi:hypothetical protein